MIDPATVITTVSTALKAAKAWRDVDKAFEAASFRAQLADVIDALTDAKLALADAKENVANKDQEIARLIETNEERSMLKLGIGGYKYFSDTDSSYIGFPLCPKCEKLHGRIASLVQDGAVNNAKCPLCDTQFKPVTCYLPGGGTLLDREVAIKSQRNVETNRKISKMNSINSRSIC